MHLDPDSLQIHPNPPAAHQPFRVSYQVLVDEGEHPAGHWDYVRLYGTNGHDHSQPVQAPDGGSNYTMFVDFEGVEPDFYKVLVSVNQQEWDGHVDVTVAEPEHHDDPSAWAPAGPTEPVIVAGSIRTEPAPPVENQDFQIHWQGVSNDASQQDHVMILKDGNSVIYDNWVAVQGEVGQHYQGTIHVSGHEAYLNHEHRYTIRVWPHGYEKPDCEVEIEVAADPNLVTQ